MSISTSAFERAQEQELANWVKDTTNSRRILYELVEHGEIAPTPSETHHGARTHVLLDCP